MIRAVVAFSPRWRSVLLACGLGLLAACASAPVQEMSDARQAVAAAAQSGGDQKAAAQMREARAALAQAETALKQLKYKMARQWAQQARTKAIEAQQLAGP